jgi:two-component sensor histidine kinase
VLRKSIGNFTRGDRRLEELDLRGAPEELHQVAEAYLAMTESVTRVETRLEDSAHQKEVLLREVHHRVKNNLQLISSIMSIQMRRAHSDEAKGLLKGLQDRVISLATIHRELYQTSGLADVRADELFPDIVRQIISVSTGSDQPFSLDSDFDDLRLVPDQAVPLSLLLAEALTNALKHSDATGRDPGQIRVRLKRSGSSKAVLEVTNRCPGQAIHAAPGAGRNPGVGSQLIAAFATQLGGVLETGTARNHYSLRLTFTVAPLAEGEDRTQTPA